MSQVSMPSIRPFNNDNMPNFAQFQARLQAAHTRQSNLSSLDSEGSAAVAFNTAAPRPAQLDDSQAQNALQNVQQATDISGMHKNLDPERVARLLGLLD